MEGESQAFGVRGVTGLGRRADQGLYIHFGVIVRDERCLVL